MGQLISLVKVQPKKNNRTLISLIKGLFSNVLVDPYDRKIKENRSNLGRVLKKVLQFCEKRTLDTK